MLYSLGVFFVISAIICLGFDYSEPLLVRIAFGLLITSIPIFYGAREEQKNRSRFESENLL
jgi:hypothetical protein